MNPTTDSRRQLDTRLQQLQNQGLAPQLRQILRGLEKESLRVQPNGHLAQTQHPRALGSTLTHSSITTDYSEALTEFITPTFTDLQAPLDFLHELHQFAYSVMEDEKLWVNSMPCIMGPEESIPIAEYGTSNEGLFKHVYRHGLWHRYGRVMQTIAGIHYNMSYPLGFWVGFQQILQDQQPLQTFISQQYFHLIRNFQRHVSIAIYLLGASPAVCGSFLRGQKHKLEPLHKHTLIAPFGTSLRMSDLGYHNATQKGLNISYNSLPEYVNTLYQATTTSHPDYEKIGVRVDGQYRQLNTNILQIENEYYASIRPKRRLGHHQRTLMALAESGVEYIEVRCLDLNPWQPVGIDADTLRFLDMFLLYCLLEPSPPISAQEYACIHKNQQTIVLDGRNPSHALRCGLGDVNVQTWAGHVLAQMDGIAELFDGQYGGREFQRVLAEQRAKIQSPELTPSAQVIETLKKNNQSFFEFAMQCANDTAAHFLAHPPSDALRERLTAEASESLAAQAALEAKPSSNFEHYLAQFMATPLPPVNGQNEAAHTQNTGTL
ncbi:Glutamate--cysteine ligase [gamma proteobacterium HdN1]|nr:Glutamate--cysteine ligase [gamma proteobacterium HdN1]